MWGLWSLALRVRENKETRREELNELQSLRNAMTGGQKSVEVESASFSLLCSMCIGWSRTYYRRERSIGDVASYNIERVTSLFHSKKRRSLPERHKMLSSLFFFRLYRFQNKKNTLLFCGKLCLFHSRVSSLGISRTPDILQLYYYVIVKWFFLFRSILIHCIFF